MVWSLTSALSPFSNVLPDPRCQEVEGVLEEVTSSHRIIFSAIRACGIARKIVEWIPEPSERIQALAKWQRGIDLPFYTTAPLLDGARLAFEHFNCPTHSGVSHLTVVPGILLGAVLWLLPGDTEGTWPAMFWTLFASSYSFQVEPRLKKSVGGFLSVFVVQLVAAYAFCVFASVVVLVRKTYRDPFKNGDRAYKALRYRNPNAALRYVSRGIAPPGAFMKKMTLADGTNIAPFHLLVSAVRSGNLDLVREILRQHPRTRCLSTPDEYGYTPLDAAMQSKNEEIVLLLLEYPSGWERPLALRTNLMHVREGSRHAMIASIMRPFVQETGCTYLHLAARMGLGRVVDRLLELAPDQVDRLSSLGSSPLTFALVEENYEIAGKLRRARTNREDTIDRRTISESVWARFMGNPEIGMLTILLRDRIPVDLYLPMVEAHLEENIARSGERATQATLGAIRSGGYSPEA